MSRIGSTLAWKVVTPVKAVDKIINCTETVMYVYGTSGMLLELTPREFDLSKVRLKNKGVLYVVDQDTEKQLLEIDEQFAEIIVHPNYFGVGRDGENIYKFSIDQENVVPITDRCGKSGGTFYR